MAKARKTRQTALPGMDDVKADAPARGRSARSEKHPSTVDTVREGEAPAEPATSSNDGPAATRNAGQASRATRESTQGTARQTTPVPFATSAPPPDLTGKSVWVVDANSLIYQVFHAIPEMTSPRGEPVNAVFGFTRDLLFLLDKKRPDYLFCSFDMAGPTFRHELYEDYKVHRAETPDALVPQFPAIRRMIEALGIPILELESYEADDVLATVARATRELGGHCVLVTGDKDCRQLIGDRVSVYNVRKDQMYDVAALAADWGIRPEQVVDFQAIVGDSVDNVPGIPLIGPKIAQDLLTRFESLEGIFAHADQIAGEKRRQNILAHQQQALLSRQLVRLDAEVPIAIDWAAGRTGRANVDEVLGLCAEFGFHRFAEQVRAWQSTDDAPNWQFDVRLIGTIAELHDLVADARNQPRVALHVVGTSPVAMEAQIAGMALAWTTQQAYFVPMANGARDNAGPGAQPLDRAAALVALLPLLADPDVGKVSADLKFDTVLLRNAEVEPQGMAFDTTLASYLLDAGERNHTLGELAQRHLNHTLAQSPAAAASHNEDASTNAESSAQAIAAAAGEAALIVWRLVPLLEEKLSAQQLDSLLRDVEVPLAGVLAEMERTGIRVDTKRLAELSEEYGRRCAALEAEVYALAGHEFNIASPKQVQQVLFVEQRLPTLRRIKSGASTDAAVLEELAQHHPLPAKIIEYRQYSKLKNTYVDALPALVNPRTGRVHATFQQAVAATGRLSSSDPNLQNIPIRSREGREIRSAFLPGPEGWRLLSADYSQIELRVLAHFSRDAALCAAFARGDDIHTQVASQVFGVSPDAVDSEMRRRAKAVNFGVLYGQSPFGLAKALGISQEEAAEFIDAYFRRYPGVERFLARILAECGQQGFVKTILGRRRAIRGIRPEPGPQRNLPERTAINTVIQGSAADLIKLAMLAVPRALQDAGLSARMLLQIHDELVFETPPDELEALADLVRREMSGVMPLDVPLVVDVTTGATWADAETWGETLATELPALADDEPMTDE